MIGVLVRKELAGMRSFVAAALVLGGGSTLLGAFVAEIPSSKSLDMGVLSSLVWGTWFNVVVLGMVMGTLLLQEEFEVGTQGFLDTLPTTRTQVFVSKVLAAWLVLSVLPLSELVVAMGLHATVARPGLDGSTHPEMLVPLAAYALLYGPVLLGWSLPLSYLGRIGWMCLGAWLMVGASLESAIPELAPLSMSAMADITIYATRYDLPITALVVQCVISAVGYGMAWFVYTERVPTLPVVTRVQRSGFMRAVGFGMTGLLVLGSLAFLGYTFDKENNKEDDEEQHVLATAYYRIAYDDGEQALAVGLAQTADADLEDIAMQMGLEAQADNPFLVDTRGMGSSGHLAGTYSANTIRMGLSGPPDPRFVLAHESVHGLFMRTAPEFVERYGGRFGTFNEGLADWLDRRVAGTSQEVCLDEAAFLMLRHQIDADALFAGSLTGELGPEAVYTVGCAMWEYLLTDGGLALSDAVAALSAPSNLDEDTGRDGIVAWFDSMDRSYDESVAGLADALRARASRIEGWMELPTPRVRIDRMEESLLSMVRTSDLPEGLKLRVRARAHVGDPVGSYTFGRRIVADEEQGEHVRLRIPLEASDHMELQAGYVLSPTVTLWWPFRQMALEVVEGEALGGSSAAVQSPAISEVVVEPEELPASPPAVSWGRPVVTAGPFSP